VRNIVSMKTEGKSNNISLTEEDVLHITKTAIIIIELEKIKEEYSNTEWEGREEVIKKLYKYSDHSNCQLAKEVFYFLSNVVEQTRGGMTPSIATLYIFWFLNLIVKKTRKK
jgi:hypothetical protein